MYLALGGLDTFSVWLSDTGRMDADPTRGNDGGGMGDSDIPQSAAKWQLAMGQSSSSSSALFRWFCWPNAENTRRRTQAPTGVKNFQWWNSF